MIDRSETQARRNFLKDNAASVAQASANVPQRGGGLPTGPWDGLVLKKGAFFAGSILFLLLLLTLSYITPTAYAATHHVNHPFSGPVNFTLYTHIATSANSTGDYTDLDNHVTNNNPNAFIEVTPNYSPNGVYDDHPIGVWYHAGRWSIFNQDLTPIPVNAAFNVEALPYAFEYGPFSTVHVATAANSVGDFTDINTPASNGHPEAIVTVTPNWSPYEVYDNHPIGVWYHNGVWSIFNQDLTPIPANAAFNVTVEAPVDNIYTNVSVHLATTANSVGDYTDLNTMATNSHPETIVFVTPNFDPYNVYNNHNTGVWYHDGVWSIFNQDLTPIPTNATFNVFATNISV